jgi:hypothetical protein
MKTCLPQFPLKEMTMSFGSSVLKLWRYPLTAMPPGFSELLEKYGLCDVPVVTDDGRASF